MTTSTHQRFWEKVDKTGECWLWTAATVHNGYGKFWRSGKHVYSHRYAYELLVGPIPDGKQLDHLCRVRHCVNPAHLEPVTQRENIRRGEGMGAVNAAKTHCPQRHPYDLENTYRYPIGGRKCRTCKRDRRKEMRRMELDKLGMSVAY